MPARRTPPTTKLWQYGLHWLDSAINVQIPHPFDVERIKALLVGLHRVGERPTYEEVKAYLARLWPLAPRTQATVRDYWRTLLRNPNHEFQWGYDEDLPLYTVDWLIEQHGLRSLERRLGVVLRDAARDYHAAAVGDHQAAYVAAQKTMATAIASVHSTRRLRVGTAALGEPVYPLGDEPAGLPRRPRQAGD